MGEMEKKIQKTVGDWLRLVFTILLSLGLLGLFLLLIIQPKIVIKYPFFLILAIVGVVWCGKRAAPRRPGDPGG